MPREKSSKVMVLLHKEKGDEFSLSSSSGCWHAPMLICFESKISLLFLSLSLCLSSPYSYAKDKAAGWFSACCFGDISQLMKMNEKKATGVSRSSCHSCRVWSNELSLMILATSSRIFRHRLDWLVYCPSCIKLSPSDQPTFPSFSFSLVTKKQIPTDRFQIH